MEHQESVASGFDMEVAHAGEQFLECEDGKATLFCFFVEEIYFIVKQ